MAFKFLKGPPPLPPKDDHYVRPLSPLYPSDSSTSSNLNVDSSSSLMSTTTTTSTNNKLSISSLLTRLPKSLPTSSREAEHSPKEDENISLPWNFQHHIHVDEGYVGLPPSWLTSTFTEEEIAQIQARRAAMLHGVGGYNQGLMRPPSPTSSLYPSVIQGHRRNKSSSDSPASSSTPNLLLPSSASLSTTPPKPIHSLSSTNLASSPSGPFPFPPPLRPASPAPTTSNFSTNGSFTHLPIQHPPTTPSSASFSLASRNILSDLSSASSNIVGAVKSSAGKGIRIFRVKRPHILGGASSGPPSSYDNSTKGRNTVHSRLSDETFFAPEIISPDRVTIGSGSVISPTSSSPGAKAPATVAPVWELYHTSDGSPFYGRPGTGTTTIGPYRQQHMPRPSTSSAISHAHSLSRSSSIHRPNTSASSTVNPNSSSSNHSHVTGNLTRSRTPSLSKNASPFLARSLSRSKSQSSLSSARSLSRPSPSAASAHPLPSSSSTSTPPMPSLPAPSVLFPSPSTSSSSAQLIQPHLPHRPPHLMPSHSHSGSMSSLVSIPEASPAPGAVVPVPSVPAVPPVFGALKRSLKRKAVPAVLRNAGVNDSSSSRHHASSSIASASTTSHSGSQSQTHLANAGSSSHSYSHPVPPPSSQSQQKPNHNHTGSTSSQQSTSSTNSKKSNTSILNSRARSISTSSHSDSSSSSHTREHIHEETPVPMLSLSLPRLSLSLPFGEGSFFGGGSPLGGGFGGVSGTSNTSSFGQAASSSSSRIGMGKWAEFSTTKTATNTIVASNAYVLGSGPGVTNTNGSFSSAGVSTSQQGSPPPPPPKPIAKSTLPFPSSGTAFASSSTLNLPPSSNPRLGSTSSPNLPSTSHLTSTNLTSLPTTPFNTSTSTSSTTPAPPTLMPPAPIAMSPSRRRPLPSSKPYPGYPVPALPSAPPGPSPSLAVAGSNGVVDMGTSKDAGVTKLTPVPPTPFSSFIPSGESMNGGVRQPLPLPVPPLSLPVASGSGLGNQSTTSTTTPNAATAQQQSDPTSLLSPPPLSAMLTPTSPFGNAASAAQSPNSAQLWSEIAQMMDPGMLSAIPGLHLSTALPEDVRDAVRRAGEQGRGEEGPKEDKGEVGGTKGKGGGDVMLVGDVVGPSPPVSGGIEDGSTSRVETIVDGEIEDEDSEDEETYNAVVQSASVVVTRHHPHSPLPQPPGHPHLHPQPLLIPALPRVVEPLRTFGRPRLVNVNVNGTGSEYAKSKEELEEREGDPDVERDKLKISTVNDWDSIRSSTATIMPPHGVVDHSATRMNEHAGEGKYPNERSHRPPSMKLVISNGIGHATSVVGNGAEPSALGTTEVSTAMTDGANGSPFLSYYLDGADDTPSPLPSPGSALGSPLRDGPMDDSDGFTPSSMYSSRRYAFEDGYENGYEHDEYRLGYQNQNNRWNSRDEDDIYVEETEGEERGSPRVPGQQPRALPLPLTTPTIVLNDGTHSPTADGEDRTRTNMAPLNGAQPSISTSSSASDLTDNSLSPAPSPFQQRYRGWVSTVVAPLSEFIDEAVDPRDHYLDLAEIAEGESGSVFAARLNRSNAKKLKLGEVVRMLDFDDLGLHDDNSDEVGVDNNEEKTKLVAIKSIALVPSGTPKLVDLQKELNLMKGLWHSHMLSVDAVYVDLVEDSVWLRMELMERSLADVIVLVEAGLVLQERTIARFASDVLLALEFLLRHDIAHRDVRSDNVLVNNQGILKLADFSNAVRVDPTRPLYTDVVGVPYWQAPELLLHSSSSSSTPSTASGRTAPPYDPLKLDVWSLGSTVWEMAETTPPFFNTNKFEDRWPPLSQPSLYSPAFHEFLKKCSEPAALRPNADELLKAPFINNACGRPVIVQLLAQCRTIEWTLREQNDDDP